MIGAYHDACYQQFVPFVLFFRFLFFVPNPHTDTNNSAMNGKISQPRAHTEAEKRHGYAHFVIAQTMVCVCVCVSC